MSGPAGCSCITYLEWVLARDKVLQALSCTSLFLRQLPGLWQGPSWFVEVQKQCGAWVTIMGQDLECWDAHVQNALHITDLAHRALIKQMCRAWVATGAGWA